MAFRLVDSHFIISNNMLDKDYELPCTTTGCDIPKIKKHDGARNGSF